MFLGAGIESHTTVKGGRRRIQGNICEQHVDDCANATRNSNRQNVWRGFAKVDVFGRGD